MAPIRGKGEGRATNGGGSRSTRSAAPRTSANVYDEMVAEATALEERHSTDERPLKRRKVAIRDFQNGQGGGTLMAQPVSVPTTPAAPKSTPRNVQTIEASDDDDDDDESELDFEDVDLDRRRSTEVEMGIQDVSISVGSSTTPQKPTPSKRKPASAAEKAFRILVHKSHLLCLLGHCMFVNTWCNDVHAHEHLRELLDARAVSNLTLGPKKSQFDRDRWFVKGLAEVVGLFKVAFKVTASGLRRSKWATGSDDAAAMVHTEPIDRTEFIRAAKAMSGSQDVGNQLFCALLRSIGVKARLVCSLQVLPFASISGSSATPQKQAKPMVFATPPAYGSDRSANTDSEDSSVSTSKRIGKVPAVKRRLGQPAFSSGSTVSPALNAPKRSVRTLSYPVFWIEAFNAAYQKWVAVDPVVTHTVNEPAKLEPPGSYEANQLTYVVAFEDDGVVVDVTRRYAKAYNAKTRRQRVDSLENGAEWWEHALQLFRRQDPRQDRDQVEDSELSAKEAREPMPNNVQDYKNHPYYALERHLRRHEVIHPRKSAGKANLGTNANPKMEPVFRRAQVLPCWSADKWYRKGRKVKEGELPLKHITTRVRAKEVDEGEEESTKTTALYADFQTELYVPPPVVKGKVPRNAFGNLDIYVPSMIPAGGAHVRHELARQAAQILRIDCVDAVTGFTFKGRHGTAVIQGVVVAKQYADAVQAVIEGMETEQEEEASMKRSLIALQLWHRFLTGLRIRERVSEYGELSKQNVDANTAEHPMNGEGADFATVDVDSAFTTAGRFSMDELKAFTTPKKRKQKKKPDSDEEDYESDNEDDHVSYAESAGGFMAEDDGRGGFIPTDDMGGGFLPDAPDFPNEGGGFMADDEQDYDDAMPDGPDDEGGGFVPNEAVDEPEQPVSTNADAAAVEEILPSHSEMLRATHVQDTNEEPMNDASVATEGVKDTTSLANEATDQPAVVDGGNGSDHGSLLSHDPEDDDAEPDWLESD